MSFLGLVHDIQRSGVEGILFANKDSLGLGFAAFVKGEYLLLRNYYFINGIGTSFGQIAQPQGFNSWVWTSIFHPALTLTFWVTSGEKTYYMFPYSSH